jgi:hypothetical protein
VKTEHAAVQNWSADITSTISSSVLEQAVNISLNCIY